MGLRELKAERTRRRIVEVATELFVGQGFDETTMELIAERAEVGSTTLYRYFPSKDVIALEPLRGFLELGDALRRRPADEPLPESLGAIMLDLTDIQLEQVDRLAAVRRIIDNAPGPRAQLWDLMARGRAELTAALAERMDRDAGAPDADLTAMVVFVTLEYAWDRWLASGPGVSRRQMLGAVIAEVSRAKLVLPVPPPSE